MKKLKEIENNVNKIYKEYIDKQKIEIYVNELDEDDHWKFMYRYRYNGKEFFVDSFMSNDKNKNVEETIKTLIYNSEEIPSYLKMSEMLINKRYNIHQ